MADEGTRDVTFVPASSDLLQDGVGDKKRDTSSLLESIYWQTLGWVHTPLFSNAEPSTDALEFRERAAGRRKRVDLKLQVEDKVPYGVLPKEVVAEIERRKFDRQDLKSILREVGIEPEALLPRTVVYTDRIEILDSGHVEGGIPRRPFLDLETFDDWWYFDPRSPEDWLSSGGGSENGAVAGQAFVPEEGTTTNLAESMNFDWRPVAVRDYDPQKGLYQVEYQGAATGGPGIWLPRVYLKFEAEEPLRFAKRLLTALQTRHTVEESLRMTYYVDCMPLDDAPDCPQEHLDAIYSKVRRSRQLQPKLKWIKSEWETIAQEIKLEYKKTLNAISYEEIANQAPSLTREFSNVRFQFQTRRKAGSKVDLDFAFLERLEQFRYSTLYTSPEAVQALTMVQANVLALQDRSLYVLPLDDIYTLERFEALQREQLQSMQKYVHETWMTNIASAIQHSFEGCGKGQYDLNQKAQHTLQLTKLGRLLKTAMFKMQDVIRLLVTESLEKYAALVLEACDPVKNIQDNFTWEDDLSNDKYSPPQAPLFEVPLEIKGDRLKFGVDIKKYASLVKDLFLEGLKVTKDLPRLEKLVLKRMLYNPDHKLETVTEREKQVVSWRMNITKGMDQAIIVANAYIRAFNPLLKPFKTDQINYVKQFARRKVNCDQLKEIIEMHNEEKTKLEKFIPAFLDIGPFRLATKTVRAAAMKKHEQLADAVLGYFCQKLNQFMESIKDEFLVLLDRIKQPTGNIEDLLEKKQWCRTVPKKIENLSADVNRLRSDFRLLSIFYRNMDDEDFSTYWQVQEYPQVTMKMLEHRISTFDAERNEHKDHLSSDVQKLKMNLEQLKESVTNLRDCSDLKQAQSVATKVRKIRKNLIKYEEQAQLYKKRVKLLAQPQTDYPEIDEMSKALVPYENFWLSAAEFYKYNERDIADLFSMDRKQLKEAIGDFNKNLKSALEYFNEEEHPDIHSSIALVLVDLKEFIKTKLSKVL